MEFPTPRSTLMEAVLSLQHIFRVAKAVNVDPTTGFEGAVVYIVNENDVHIVAQTWERAFDDAPGLAVVVVNELPRGARVEWHVLRCQKLSDETSESKFQMTFSDHQLRAAISDIRRDHGTLCMIFGSQASAPLIKSKYKDVAVQMIPSNTVFSVSNGVIERQSSCTFILSE